MRAAAFLALALLSGGCVSFPPRTLQSWKPGEFRAAPLSGSARPMDYYARRWSSTELGPAYGWKLLDQADARTRPWVLPGKRWAGTLEAMRAANLEEAARLGLSATVKLSAGPEGLMPLSELTAEAAFQAEPWTYLAWYRIQDGCAGPWCGEFLVGRQLRALGRPELAGRYEAGHLVGILGATAMGVGLAFAQLSAFLPYPPWVLTAVLGTLGGGALVLGGAASQNSAVKEHNAALDRLRAPPKP